jgi:hypothetical protein
MLVSKIGIAIIVTALVYMQGLQASGNPQRVASKPTIWMSSEAVSILGILNRAQQAYQLKKGDFAKKNRSA